MPADASRDPCRRTVTFVFTDGGAGLYPLTRDREKLAVPFGGEYRMVDFVLSNCLNSGLRRIRVFVRRRSLELDRHLGLGWNVFSSELGEFLEVVSPPGRPTGGAGRLAAPALLGGLDAPGRTEAVCVLLGDHLCRADYGKLLRRHFALGADLTVACGPAPAGRSGLDTLEVDAEGRVTGVACAGAARRRDAGTTLAPTGAYVFSVEALSRLAGELGPCRPGLDLPDVVRAAARRGRTFAWTPPDPARAAGVPRTRDVRTVDAYYDANMDLVGDSPALDLFDGAWPVRTRREQRPPTRIVSGRGSGGAERCLVAAGCLIDGGRAQGSVLFPRVRLHEGSCASDSILMQGVELGAGAVVRRAIVDEGVAVPPGERIGVDPERDRRRFMVSPGGVVVVPRETRIA